MTVTRLLAVAVLTSVCAAPAACGGASDSREKTSTDLAIEEGARKTSTDPAVNPDAEAMAEFERKVEEYAALHERLANGDAQHRETADPARIDRATDSIAARVQAARQDARHGDIFTPAVRPAFRRLLAPELQGADGRVTKAAIRDEAPAPGTVPFKVNAKYPEGQPLPTMPAHVLITLPRLPAPLEYRIVGQHLLLIDTSAELVVDYILNATVT
jgi:hypothetical protein